MDNRLLACAEFVRENSKVVDVGTDHAYLACFLAKKDDIKSVIACDVNEKPLQMAKKTVIDNKLQDRVKLVLSNGLEKIQENEADDIIIAGMGGELILSIILACKFSKNRDKHFIVQPMTQAPLLRKELYKNGFEIIKEKAVYENKHHYTVMLCRYCGEEKQITEEFSIVGLLGDDTLQSSKEYCLFQINKLKKIVAGLQKTNNKQEEIQKYNDIISNLEKQVK